MEEWGRGAVGRARSGLALHAAKGGIGCDVFARDILREGGQGGGRRTGACSTAPQVYRAPPRAPATKVRLGRVVFVRDIQCESVPDPRGGLVARVGGKKKAATPALGLPDPSPPRGGVLDTAVSQHVLAPALRPVARPRRVSYPAAPELTTSGPTVLVPLAARDLAHRRHWTQSAPLPLHVWPMSAHFSPCPCQ